MGKSQMAVNICSDLCNQGKRVFYISHEMPKEKILERLFCLNEEVDNIELLKGGYLKNPMIREKFNNFKEKIKGWKLYISDCLGKDWDWMDAEVFPLFMDKPVDCVVIDHLQEIRGGKSQKESLDFYLEKLRTSAVRNNFALIACSQIGREAMSKDYKGSAQLFHLSGSSGIEQMADTVFILQWKYQINKEDCEDKNEFIIHVAKNRDGNTGFVKMFYTPEYCMIRDYPAETIPEPRQFAASFTETPEEWRA